MIAGGAHKPGTARSADGSAHDSAHRVRPLPCFYFGANADWSIGALNAPVLSLPIAYR